MYGILKRGPDRTRQEQTATTNRRIAECNQSNRANAIPGPGHAILPNVLDI
jgi:hypothetical protein